MNKLRWIFFLVFLLGFLGFLGWSGYIYYDRYQNRQADWESSFKPIKSLLDVISQEGDLVDLIEPIARDLMVEKPVIRFVSLGQNEKILLFLARAGITIPKDLNQRTFPGYTPIPFFHHYLQLTFLHKASFYSLGIWIDPVWTWLDLELWFWPLILLAGVILSGIVFIVILALAGQGPGRQDRTAASQPKKIASPQRTPTQPQARKEQKAGGNLYDDGGLVWNDFLEPRLDTELNRSTSENQDLCLVYAEVEGPKGWEPTALDLIQVFLPYRDLVYRTEKGFALIQPKTELEKLFEFLRKFVRDFGSLRKDNKIKMGFSARSGRIIAPKLLMEEARSALSKAGFQQDQIVGFKADPALYREYLNSLA